MRTLHNTILILLIALGSPAKAQTSFAAEFSKLKEQRQKELDAAAEPVNRHYVEAFQQLLRRASTGGDLDTALKVREDLERLGVTTSTGAAPLAGTVAAATQSFEHRMIGSTWTLTTENKVETVELKAKGELILGWDKAAKGFKWRAARDGVIELFVYKDRVSFDTIDVAPDGRKGTLTRRGKKFETTRIK